MSRRQPAQSPAPTGSRAPPRPSTSGSSSWSGRSRRRCGTGRAGGHQAARDVAAACGLPLLVAHRTLDPQLRELNRRGALNGHVPVTAIVSLVAVAQALVIGADQVIFSNERSANVGSFTHNGLPV